MSNCKHWFVVTPSGLAVFEGSRERCRSYIVQALRKGSCPGFLRIVSELPDQEVPADE